MSSAIDNGWGNRVRYERITDAELAALLAEKQAKKAEPQEPISGLPTDAEVDPAAPL